MCLIWKWKIGCQDMCSQRDGSNRPCSTEGLGWYSLVPGVWWDQPMHNSVASQMIKVTASRVRLWWFRLTSIGCEWCDCERVLCAFQTQELRSYSINPWKHPVHSVCYTIATGPNVYWNLRTIGFSLPHNDLIVSTTPTRIVICS